VTAGEGAGGVALGNCALGRLMLSNLALERRDCCMQPRRRGGQSSALHWKLRTTVADHSG
jgi:hypothetical protein